MKPQITQGPEVAVLAHDRDFVALEEEWKDLYHNCPLATPFQSWAWLYSWWEAYGEGYDLRLIAVRYEGTLIGIVPLMLERQWSYFGRLLFIGNGPTDYLDILARQGCEAQVTEAAVGALMGMKSWHVADLQELRPEAAAWGIFRAWRGSRARVQQSSCPAIDVRPWDDLLSSLSRNLRSTVRRALRKVENEGVVSDLASVEDVERAARRFIYLHREMWRGRDISPEHLTQKFESHMVAAIRRMTAYELGGISEFRRDGETVAAHFLVFGRDFVGEHLFGATQETVQRYQISSLNVWDAVNVALGKNKTRVSFLRGEEPYKLRWASEIVPNDRVILGRRLAFGRLYLAYLSLRAMAGQYVRSGSTPLWIKTAVNRVRRR